MGRNSISNTRLIHTHTYTRTHVHPHPLLSSHFRFQTKTCSPLYHTYSVPIEALPGTGLLLLCCRTAPRKKRVHKTTNKWSGFMHDPPVLVTQNNKTKTNQRAALFLSLPYCFSLSPHPPPPTTIPSSPSRGTATLSPALDAAYLLRSSHCLGGGAAVTPGKPKRIHLISLCFILPLNKTQKTQQAVIIVNTEKSPNK